MLRLPRFRFHLADSVGEAARILSGEGPAARVVAGGTDLWPNMKRRHQRAETVVSLMGVPELNGIETSGTTGELRIGATTSLADVARHRAVQERFPALAHAVRSVSSPPLRNMGTLGGNLCLDTRCTYYNQTESWRRSIDYCMKEAGTVCWVAPSSSRCWAHSASDTAPILCALGARVRLVGAAGERVIPVASLFQNDGIAYLTKGADEIVASILLPRDSDGSRVRSSFRKLRRRGSIDFAVLSSAAALWQDAGGVVTRAEIFLGAVSSWPLPATAAARFLTGRPLTEDTVLEAARLAGKVATPMDNTDFQAQWRGKMAVAYTAAVLREAGGLSSTAA